MTTKIAVIGMGYVGIPCAALLAEVDEYHVTGIQRRSVRSGWKIEMLNSGKSPFEGNEPGLDELIESVVKKGTFKVTDDFNVLKEMDIVLIDVQTPTDENHQPQYVSLKEVSHTLGKLMKPGSLIVIESTVAPGTTQNIVQPILEEESGMKGGEDFHLAFSYERVMPGHLIEFIVDFPRVVGGISPESTRRAVEMYKKIVKKTVHSTDTLTAELTKTIENAYRDVNIAFANEMALVCESLGVNVFEVRDLINERHDRHMHIPGTGVGGHCLPKDSWLLRHGLHEYGLVRVEPEFIALARKINDFMPVHAAELIMQALAEKKISTKDAKVAVLGIAYLEDSDDVRNTPSTALIETLERHGITVKAHDPFVRQQEYPHAQIVRDLHIALRDVDAAIIATKHAEYYKMDPEKLKSLMRTHIMVDGRNVLPGKEWEAKGFIYKGVGKGKIQ